MTGPSFDRVKGMLREVTTEGARPSGAWTLFRCPVPEHGSGHGDRNPSLGVKYDPRREKTVVNCFGLCPQDRVLEVARIEVRDLFDRLPERDGRTQPAPQRRERERPAAPKPAGPRKVRDLGEPVGPARKVAEYVYTNVGGANVGKVARKHVPCERGIEKTFYQHRWDNDRRMWVPGGFAPVLYNAPGVEAARRAGLPVLVCEGEKDVDRARGEQVAATCNAGGAGKFSREHAAGLDGVDLVVVVADRDQPGYLHAAGVAELLEARGHEVRVTRATVGKDLSDHLAAGYAVGELVPIDRAQLAEYRREHGTPRQPVERSSTGPRLASAVGRGGFNREWGFER